MNLTPRNTDNDSDFNSPDSLILPDWTSLLTKISRTLKTVGSEKFYSSTNEETKKDRESLALLFFMTALKKNSGYDWFLSPVPHQEQFPDFRLISFNEQGIGFMQVELVEVSVRCQTFDEALDAIKNKLDHYAPTQAELLVYVNNTQSHTWVQQLRHVCSSRGPFKAIWTIRLISALNKSNTLVGSIVDRILPHPIHIETNLDDPVLYRIQPLSPFMEEGMENGKTYRRVRPEVMKDIRFRIRRELLKHNR